MRPSRDETMLRVAEALALRSTCLKRAVGCVIADEGGEILATGYNGVAKGRPHCNEADGPATLEGIERYDHACNDGRPIPDGSDLCEAVHAESNAMRQCRAPKEAATVYVTVSPCWRCAKELLNLPARRLVVRALGPDWARVEALWTRDGRTWTLVP